MKQAYIFSHRSETKETDTRGIFQLSFYEDLFASSFKSSIVNDEKLTKSSIRKLLDEILELDKDASKEKWKCLFLKME